MTTLSQWKTILAGQVEAAATALDIDTVVRGEPRELHGSVVVTVSTAGSTGHSWLIALRCYVSGRLDPISAQDRLDQVVEGLVSRLDSRFGPDAWEEVEWVDELQALVVTCVLDVPRAFED